MSNDPLIANHDHARQTLAAIERVLADYDAGSISGALAASTVGQTFHEYAASSYTDFEETSLHEAGRMLVAAEAFACRAHAGQTERIALPYLMRTKRIAARAHAHAEAISRKPEFAVLCELACWLGGMIADMNTTVDDLRRAGYSPAVMRAVERLVQPSDVPYPDYIRTLIASGDLIAMTVKLAADEDGIDPLWLSKASMPSNQVAQRTWSAALLRSNLLPNSPVVPSAGDEERTAV